MAYRRVVIDDERPAVAFLMRPWGHRRAGWTERRP